MKKIKASDILYFQPSVSEGDNDCAYNSPDVFIVPVLELMRTEMSQFMLIAPRDHLAVIHLTSFCDVLPAIDERLEWGSTI